MKIRCPRCAAEMVEVDLYRSSTEYCGNCGYGADVAARQLRAHMIGLWWASGVGLLFGLIAWKRGPVGPIRNRDARKSDCTAQWVTRPGMDSEGR